MSNTNQIYTKRVLHQRLHRDKQKEQYEQTVNSDSDCSSNSTVDKLDDIYFELSDDESIISPLNQFQNDDYGENRYLPDNDDNISMNDDTLFQHNNTFSLYEQSPVSTGEAVGRLMKFCINSNFDKKKVVTLMCLIKSILPSPNKLPTTFRQILNVFGKTPSFIAKLYCNNCWALTTTKNNQQYCTNSSCTLSDSQLSKRQATEVTTLDLREKLQSIVRRNFSLFTGHDELFPSFDIPSGNRYQSKTKSIVYPITLNIHADGAPLIRSSKSAVWPCFSSIVELPPPVREYQTNILTLGLWISCIKPNVNLFLDDIIKQLSDLSHNGTSIFIDEHEFKINVKTQFFVSDLPAKALFMKTINFNGYFACTNCMTEGVLYNRQVIYPYKNNNFYSRTHSQFTATAKEVEVKLASGGKRCTPIAGIKGISSLLKLFHYPVDIIYDYMHLVCLHRVPALIKRFTEVLSKDAIAEVDSMLSSIRLQHDCHVKFNYSIQSIHDWKAKHTRLFILNVGLPIMIQYLPTLYSSHFSIYCMFVKILHCPKTLEEIKLADKLIHYYCQTSSTVYDPKIELYSLHAHLHLPAQVLNHGGLAFTSSFCFESMIHYIKNKAFGTKNLGSQIMYWLELDAAISTKQFELQLPSLILSEKNVYQRPYHTQRLTKTKNNFSCIVYIDEPSKYSIVESKRLVNIDEHGCSIIKELGKTYNVRVEQTGAQEPMERYVSSHKEISLREIAFGEMSSTSYKTIHTSSSSSSSFIPAECDILDTRKDSNVLASGSQYFFFEEVIPAVSSEEENDTRKNLQLKFTPVPTGGVNSKKRSVARKKIPIPKRLQFSTNDNDDDAREGQHMDLQPLLNHIPIALENDDEPVNIDNEQYNGQDSTYTRSDGTVIELLSVHGTKQNTIKFALNLIDLVFVDKQDFQNINVKQADNDLRIKAIYNAVKQKFGYSSEEMSIVWPPMHESILSKRRNQQKKLNSSTNTSEIL
ncbi:unnamed protein product [Rotaria socialis]